MKERLIFTVIGVIVTSFLLVNICRADDIDDTIFTNTKFQVKETFNIPDGIQSVHPDRSIDIYRMVEGIKYDRRNNEFSKTEN